MSTIGGQRISTHSLTFPEWGQWRLDAVLEGGALPSGVVSCTIVDLDLTGTVESAGYDAPDRPHVVVVGGLGWDAEIPTPPNPRLSFQSDAGVRLSSVLAALARGAGETVEQPDDVTIGLHYACVSSHSGGPVRYRDALEELVTAGNVEGWRVDPDGTTHFAAREGVEVTARHTELRRRADVGLVVYGVDDVTAFLPGNLIDGVPIARLVVRETPSDLTIEAWSETPPETGWRSVRTLILRMVANAFPSLVYGYPRTYVVAAVYAAGTPLLDLLPPPDAMYLPELRAVPVWTFGGGYVVPEIGAEVSVVFRDADKRRPAVVQFAPGIPVKSTADASTLYELAPSAADVEIAGGGAAAARVGSVCGRLIFDGAVTPPILYYSPGAAVPYVVVAVNPSTPTPPGFGAVGTNVVVTSGSSKVTVG